MNPFEARLFKEIEKWHQLKDKEWLRWRMEEKIKGQIFSAPLGAFTVEFLDNPLVTLLLEHNKYDLGEAWLLLAKYLLIKEELGAQSKMLAKLGAKVEKDLAEEGDIRSSPWRDKRIIQLAYLSGDDKLIALFAKKLPVPKAALFAGHPIPKQVQKTEADVSQAIKKVVESKRYAGDLAKAEKEVMTKQRKLRRKIRNREEAKRIEEQYQEFKLTKEQKAELQAIDRGPYVPQKCSERLRARLMAASEKLNQRKLFSTIHHLTSAKHLASIFNDGLFGRRTLHQLNVPFEKAALDVGDVANGDANAICFGPQKIDPQAKQTDSVRITLRLDKVVEEDNPTIFYKQKDFGYHESNYIYRPTIREVKVGRETRLFFSQSWDRVNIGTDSTRHAYAALNFYDSAPKGDAIYEKLTHPFAFARIPNVLLIAYDVHKIHQILALNFFRFLDAAQLVGGKDPEPFIKGFYSQLEALSDEALVDFLQDVGTKGSDTAEFNFFGAYRFDFDALETIRYEPRREPGIVSSLRSLFSSPDYTLQVPQFVAKLQNGNRAALQEAVKYLPNVFKSYRFIDYLLGKVKDIAVRADLQKLRAVCEVPAWVDALAKGQTAAPAKGEEKKATP